MNDYAPFDYETQNIINGLFTPSEVHNFDNQVAVYFVGKLLQKAMSVFEWKLPVTWSRDYFLYTLYLNGFISVLDVSPFGVIPQRCGLRGRNIFYEPKEIIVNNPAIAQTQERVIGENCVVLKLQPDYSSICSLIKFYAERMALTVSAIDCNLQNSKLAYVFGTDSKATAETFKKLYDKIASGAPAVVTGRKLYKDDGTPAWTFFNQSIKQQYITDDLLIDLRKLENMFDTEIGIPNANTDKRERLITDEVNANNAETATRAELWLEELRQGCEKVKTMFGVDISVDWRMKPNEQGESVNFGPVLSEQ